MIKKNEIKSIIIIALPLMAAFLAQRGMQFIDTVMMGWIGPTALAAGAKNLVQAQRTALLSFSIALATSAIIAIVFILASNFLVKIFLESGARNFKEAHQLATSFLGIAALFLCFDAMQSVANGALRGLRDTFVPMLFSIGCYWVLGVGGAYYLSMYTHLGAAGIWYGLTLGLCSAATILMLRFFQKLKIEKTKNAF